MGIELAVYSVFLLLLRWLFYITPRRKHIAAYALKAALEIGLFILLYRTRLEIILAICGLLILLNVFCYVIESRVSPADGKSRLQSLELYIGLVVYAAALVIVFLSGNIDGFSRIAVDTAGGRLVTNPRYFYAVAGGFLAVTEAEHFARFLRMKFSADGSGEVSSNGLHQAAGFGERAVVIILILLSQFIAAGIVIAGRFVSTSFSSEKHGHPALTTLSLAWALAVALGLRTLF